MSLKKWFLQLFKSTRNEERIIKFEKKFEAFNNEICRSIQNLLNGSEYFAKEIADLKCARAEIQYNAGRIDDHESGHITKTQLNYIENRCDEIGEAISDNQTHVNDLNSNYHDIFEAHLDKIKAIEQRLGKAELMHAATSKKQNELFGDAMAQMIEVSSKVSIHISDLAEKRIKEIISAMDIPNSDEFILIIMNGQPTKVRPGEMTYYDIADIFFYPYCERKKYTFCSITYKNGGDEDKPFGTISKNEVLLVKSGTVVNVTVVNVEDGG